MGRDNTTQTGLSGLLLLGLLFVGLKLGHVIGWSWWWITAPFWGPYALAMAVLLGVLVIWGYSDFYKGRKRRIE